MDVIKSALTRTLPAYLESLPLPATVSGFAELSGNEWRTLAPLLATLLLLIFSTAALLAPAPKPKPQRLNTLVKLDCDKCVDFVKCEDIEDAGKKVLCRCWKSKNFPYCDGAHAAHNKATGDNVGPLIVTKAAKAA